MTRALDYLLAFLIRAVTGIPLRDPLPGHDPERPALFYANHGSHLDSIVIWASIPPRWRRRFCVVAAADYWRPGSFRYRFARLLFDLTPVERGPAVKPSRELLERLARPLEDGKSLLIFPEGTRSRDGEIGEFRGGLHYLASRFPEVPLVPVRLDNLNRILPKGETLLVPLLARLEFLPALARIEGESKEDFLGRARAAIFSRMTDDLPLLLGGCLALLGLASVIVFWLGRRSRRLDASTIENLRARVRSWWLMAAVFGLVLVLGNVATTILFALVSFQALREFLTISPSRRSDHAPMLLSFFGFLPLQYLLVGIGWYGLFLVLIPVYGFILLPVRKVLMGETEDFLQGAARTQWALMLCVYCLSHLPLLLLLPLRNWDKSNAQLLFFLVLTAQLSDVLQYVFGKLCGRRPIAPRLSPHKTWEGFLGGVLTASAVATGLWWATPFAPWQAALLALVICLFGFAGGLVMSAIKRDLGAKDWGQGIAGHGGVLDRVDSLVFSAPLFFHLCGFFFGSGFDPSPPDWLASLVGR